MTLIGWAGSLLAAIWVWHAVAAWRGMPKVADVSTPEWDRRAYTITSAETGAATPKVSIIVPARNEEASIATAIRSLLATDYLKVEIVAIDDRSTDRTGALLDEVAREFPERLKVVHIRELPAGWLGKTHAMAVGASEASGEWLLFTDADVHHSADALRRVIAYAESQRADHVVLFPTVVMESAGERMMISFFQSLVIFGHKPWKVADPKSREHIGVGAFNLVRRSAYDAVGGYERLRMEIVDDMRLAEALKRKGFAARVVFGADLIRIRWAHGVLGIMHNLTKNMFAELRYSLAIAIAAFVFGVFVQIGPWVGLLFAPGDTRIGYMVAVAAIVSVYYRMSRRSGIDAAYVLLHPVAATLMMFTVAKSTFLAVSQSGVVWRGTKYSLDELRAGRAEL